MNVRPDRPHWWTKRNCAKHTTKSIPCCWHVSYLSYLLIYHLSYIWTFNYSPAGDFIPAAMFDVLPHWSISAPTQRRLFDTWRSWCWWSRWPWWCCSAFYHGSSSQKAYRDFHLIQLSSATNQEKTHCWKSIALNKQQQQLTRHTHKKYVHTKKKKTIKWIRIQIT